MTDLRDYSVACDAAAKWLKDHGVHVDMGVVVALARVMIAAVDEARAKRQQNNG